MKYPGLRHLISKRPPSGFQQIGKVESKPVTLLIDRTIELGIDLFNTKKEPAPGP